MEITPQFDISTRAVWLCKFLASAAIQMPALGLVDILAPEIDIPNNQTQDVARPNCVTAILRSPEGINKIRCASEACRTK